MNALHFFIFLVHSLHSVHLSYTVLIFNISWFITYTVLLQLYIRLLTLVTLWDALFFSYFAGTQEDSRGFGHGPGLPAVSGPAGLHARAHLPWWKCPGLLPGTPCGGPSEHDQWVSVSLCWKVKHTFCLWFRTRLVCLLTALWLCKLDSFSSASG